DDVLQYACDRHRRGIGFLSSRRRHRYASLANGMRTLGKWRTRLQPSNASPAQSCRFLVGRVSTRQHRVGINSDLQDERLRSLPTPPLRSGGGRARKRAGGGTTTRHSLPDVRDGTSSRDQMFSVMLTRRRAHPAPSPAPLRYAGEGKSSSPIAVYFPRRSFS